MLIPSRLNDEEYLDIYRGHWVNACDIENLNIEHLTHLCPGCIISATQFGKASTQN